MDDAWNPVETALDRAAADGRRIDVWLRDDDAVTTTPALDRLARLANRFALPILLAVIPEPADLHLAAFVAAEPLLTPTQHGFAHVNHASPHDRACELGLQRPRADVHADLMRGRDRMAALFGARASDILVPPWNRIAPELVTDLPALGFGALSTFAAAHSGTRNLDIVNCGLDIIDWRNGRVCRSVSKLTHQLVDLIDAGAPIGLLTHHLVHDEAAWRFLDEAFGRLAARPQVRFVAADRLRPGRAATGLSPG